MFPNMFPLATSQVSFFLSFFIPNSGYAARFFLFINFTIFLSVFFKLQPFSALPVMPVQAMTQQVNIAFWCDEGIFLSL